MLILFQEATHGLFNWLAFQGTVPNSIEDPDVFKILSFVYGVLGATMLAWSVAFYYIVRGPFQESERWAWCALSLPISVWFVVDSAHSIASGIWANAVFNSGFYLAFAIPLFATIPTKKN